MRTKIEATTLDGARLVANLEADRVVLEVGGEVVTLDRCLCGWIGARLVGMSMALEDVEDMAATPPPVLEALGMERFTAAIVDRQRRAVFAPPGARRI